MAVRASGEVEVETAGVPRECHRPIEIELGFSLQRTESQSKASRDKQVPLDAAVAKVVQTSETQCALNIASLSRQLLGFVACYCEWAHLAVFEVACS